jgi:hypothetical protein
MGPRNRANAAVLVLTPSALALAGREEALLRAGAGPGGMSDIYVSTREKQRSQSEDDEDGGNDEERDDD